MVMLTAALRSANDSSLWAFSRIRSVASTTSSMALATISRVCSWVCGESMSSRNSFV